MPFFHHTLRRTICAALVAWAFPMAHAWTGKPVKLLVPETAFLAGLFYLLLPWNPLL